MALELRVGTQVTEGMVSQPKERKPRRRKKCTSNGYDLTQVVNYFLGLIDGLEIQYNVYF